MRRLLLTTALMFLPMMAQAQGVSDALKNEPPMPAPLAEQKARGAQIYYLGKFDELNGWVMFRTGQPEFYYATPGNKALILGLLFDDKGVLQTGQQLQALNPQDRKTVGDMMQPKLPQVPDDNSMANLPAPTDALNPSAPPAAAATPIPAAPAATIAANPPAASPAVSNPAVSNTAAPAPAAKAPSLADNMMADVQKTSNVLWGNPALPAFWAFLDPNCPHCQTFLKQVEPFVTAGQVAVHIIPVGYSDQSTRQAALVLSSADGPQRLVAYAKGDASQLPDSPNITIDAVVNNVGIMRSWHLSGTPMILYRAGKTGDVRLIQGRPLDIGQAVTDLKGQ